MMKKKKCWRTLRYIDRVLLLFFWDDILKSVVCLRLHGILSRKIKNEKGTWRLHVSVFLHYKNQESFSYRCQNPTNVLTCKSINKLNIVIIKNKIFFNCFPKSCDMYRGRPRILFGGFKFTVEVTVNRHTENCSRSEVTRSRGGRLLATLSSRMKFSTIFLKFFMIQSPRILSRTPGWASTGDDNGVNGGSSASGPQERSPKLPDMMSGRIVKEFPFYKFIILKIFSFVYKFRRKFWTPEKS